jgi:excisionase family DNA binding protein
MDTQSIDGFLAKKEAAAYLSLSPRTLDNLVARGDLPAFRITTKILFRKRDLDLLAERNRIRSLGDIADEVIEDWRGTGQS